MIDAKGVIREFLAILLGMAISVGCGHAIAAEIPVEAAVYHVHRSDGSHKTYFDLVIGGDYGGDLPGDIQSIKVIGPDGELAIKREDFNYNPKWRAFWVVQAGIPLTGRYRFELAGPNVTGSATDTLGRVKNIPIPDHTRMRPVKGEIVVCPTTVFSWPLIKHEDPLYYQLQIRDSARQPVYRSDYVPGADEFRLPPDILKPGADYQWRIRVADGPDWIRLDNRAQSKWLPFSKPAMHERCSYPYRVPVETGDGWRSAPLQSTGIDSPGIENLRQKLFNGDYPNIHSLLIVKDGKLVLEEYFYGNARQHPHRVASVTKSITSLLIGLAIEHKNIAGTDTRVVDFFPNYTDAAGNKDLQKIRLHHVLSMTAGLDWNTWIYPDDDPRDSTHAMARSADWIGHVLGKDVVHPPGAKYVYNNGLSILLGEILRKTTGLHADRFAEKYLFRPLGITDYRWKRLDNGLVETAGGLSLRPRDMAKIGQMMLQNGSWRGKQIVSPEWVRESIRSRVDQKILLGSGYGFQWWRGRASLGTRVVDVIFAAGHGGQYIFICPEFDLVTVITSQIIDNPMGEFPPQIIMAQSIIPAMLAQPPPSRKTLPISAETIARMVGDYLSPMTLTRATIFADGGELYLRSGDDEMMPLQALSDTRFVGSSSSIGNFEAELLRDPDSGDEYFMVQIGFGFWRFDRIRD